MLTSDLLVTKISKGKIEPVYALLDQDTLEIARSVIDVFSKLYEKDIRFAFRGTGGH